MTTELLYLTYVAIFTTLMWMPYILNQISVQGLVNAVGYPEQPAELAGWAKRLKAAHYNAVENLVVFAVLVSVAHMVGITNGVTIMAVKIYFYARVLHAIVYCAAIPWLRTLSFAISWFCIIAIALQVLSA